MGNWCSGDNQQTVQTDQVTYANRQLSQQQHAFQKEQVQSPNDLVNKFTYDIQQNTTNNSHKELNQFENKQAEIEHGPNATVAQPLERVSDQYYRKQTSNIIQSLKEFVFDEDTQEDKNLPVLRPYKFLNDSIYYGKWKQGKRHGEGTQYWPDGSQYIGYWRNDKANGKGRMIDADGGYYEGQWQDDKATGKGIYRWSDGGEYEGQWKDSKMNGEGIFKWADGRLFKGNFVEDKKQGFGEYIMPDGKKYSGNWENGKLQGLATYHSQRGYQKNGIFADGKLIRWEHNDTDDQE